MPSNELSTKQVTVHTLLLVSIREYFRKLVRTIVTVDRDIPILSKLCRTVQPLTRDGHIKTRQIVGPVHLREYRIQPDDEARG